MTPSQEHIRRRPDGSIDIEHYARRASAERDATRRAALSAAIRSLLSGLAGLLRPRGSHRAIRAQKS